MELCDRRTTQCGWDAAPVGCTAGCQGNRAPFGRIRFRPKKRAVQRSRSPKIRSVCAARLPANSGSSRTLPQAAEHDHALYTIKSASIRLLRGFGALQRRLGTGEIVLVHHTDCGVLDRPRRVARRRPRYPSTSGASSVIAATTCCAANPSSSGGSAAAR